MTRLWQQQTRLSRFLLIALAVGAFEWLRLVTLAPGNPDAAWRADHARANPAAWAELAREWPDGSRNPR